MKLKLTVSREVFLGLSEEERAKMSPTRCFCANSDGSIKIPDCSDCENTRVLYEYNLSDETAAAIEENLRKQGVFKDRQGTH